LKEVDVINVGKEPYLGGMEMDVDVDMCLSPVASVDIDIDVESPVKHTSSPQTSILSSPPRQSAPLELHSKLSSQQLIAALIMRRHAPKPGRSAIGEKGSPTHIPRRPSPLAVSTY